MKVLVVLVVCLILVRLIARMTDVFFKLPLIGTANRILGLLIGVLKAFIVMSVLCTLLAIVIPVLSLEKNPPITQNMVNNTYILKYFYNANPLTGMLLKK